MPFGRLGSGGQIHGPDPSLRPVSSALQIALMGAEVAHQAPLLHPGGALSYHLSRGLARRAMRSWGGQQDINGIGMIMAYCQCMKHK